MWNNLEMHKLKSRKTARQRLNFLHTNWFLQHIGKQASQSNIIPDRSKNDRCFPRSLGFTITWQQVVGLLCGYKTNTFVVLTNCQRMT